MARYEGFSSHKVVVRDTETDMKIEKECDAYWWVNSPGWAQLYVMEGMRRELELTIAESAQALLVREYSQVERSEDELLS